MSEENPPHEILRPFYQIRDLSKRLEFDRNGVNQGARVITQMLDAAIKRAEKKLEGEDHE